MHINLETADKHSIQSYSDNEIKVDSIVYQTNIIVSSHGIIPNWNIDSILELNEESLVPLLQYNPNIVLIGHNQQGQFPPLSTLTALSKKRIALECMSIGAACRTFNILLSELREVVIGLIL
ncbi:Mth938-like domain-containing protein [Legionella micdadei]|uniref:Uncharacterized conserved protein, contains Mth938-like domain n=1 Tax=Legionella micdadei TaxID=451 RepID=A0A098GHB7_LEGMI|nr:MTH938/NDUFAF3 family protein [Legionella micdadei]ARG97559.1 hypothetical protein B6N58_07715 [Legionella micdadei]ARH00128.1 hypothetical protein B6V88_06710 [Legionella micdadei]KTD27638.1 hypothetical protein Lmic_1958 [Legionella micdadei]NSL17621.1 hypothetical protein [Legionella micdadei]CEG60876.1 conserved protein of unknown function [Legionella micdadei]